MHMSLKRRGLPVNLSCSRPWPLFWPEVGNDTHFWPVFGVKVGSASGLLVDVVVDNDLSQKWETAPKIGLFLAPKWETFC